MPITALQEAIILTNRCKAAHAAGDMIETFRLLALRDAAYLRIGETSESLKFIDFVRGRFSESEVDLMLASEDLS